MKIITVSNIKGGVAKTTTAATVAAGLHKRKKRVLMIDSDPQTNLTMCFTNEPKEGDPTLYNVYTKAMTIDEVKVEIKPGLDLVPGDFSLCSADMEFLSKVGSIKIISNAIKASKGNYDYVVIDTPPNLGILSLNAFMSSDYILTPMAADSFSLKAIRLLKQTIDDLEEDINKKIPVVGILLTRYTDRTNVAKILEDNVKKAAKILDTKLFNTRIRQATVVQESQLVKKDLFEYAPKHIVTQEYDKFITELIKRMGGK